MKRHIVPTLGKSVSDKWTNFREKGGKGAKWPGPKMPKGKSQPHQEALKIHWPPIYVAK